MPKEARRFRERLYGMPSDKIRILLGVMSHLGKSPDDVTSMLIQNAQHATSIRGSRKSVVEEELSEEEKEIEQTLTTMSEELKEMDSLEEVSATQMEEHISSQE